jgi:hypothetical protein
LRVIRNPVEGIAGNDVTGCEGCYVLNTPMRITVVGMNGCFGVMEGKEALDGPS